MRNRQVVIIVFLVVLVIAIAVGVKQTSVLEPPPTFGDVVRMVEKKEVESITFKGAHLEVVTRDGRKLTTVGPADSDYYLEYFQQNGVIPSFKETGDGQWLLVALEVVLIVAMSAMLLLFLRQVQAGSGKAMSFGKSKAKLLNESNKRITFADVAGADEAKEELQEIVQFLKEPRKFTRLGGRIPKGVLLMGSPGTGKTLLARAVAGEAGVPFFSISGSEFVEMFVGVGASRVRDLFEQAKKSAPCIVFIDEIDAVGRHRGAGLGGGHDEREQTLNQLLVEMDGFDSAEGVILVAATNRPDVLDPALLRPGRFDRRVVVPAPDVRGRLGILQVHAKRTPLSPDVDLDRIARSTAGFSGADLENLINEAALEAARLNKRQIEQVDLESARDKVAMGAERRSLVLSEAQKRRTAYHEAGHALVARMIPETDPVNKITIVPRGMALGLTQTVPAEDRYTQTRTRLTSMLVTFMGGRVAGELVYNEYDTGAASDIRRATQIAHRYVCEYGMSDVLGPVAWGERQEEVFLGRDFSRQSREFSEETAQRIDAEVRRLLTEAVATAREILSQNLHILHRVAQALVEKETLDGPEFEKIVANMNPIFPEPRTVVA